MARILIVDDEKSLRLTLGEFLREAGHDVETAEDANSAERLLVRKTFDVVVADIILPQVSGVELLKSIRGKAPDTQVILMTGEPTVDTAVEAVRAGAHDYLYKPVGKAGIQHAVERAARHKALLDEKARLEEVNRQYQDNLERMVEERTRALKESQALYHSLVENLPQYVFRKDLEGRYTFVNQRFCQSLGKTPDDLLGETSIDLFPPDLAERYQEDDAYVIATGRMRDREDEYPSLGDERRWIRVVKTPVFDAEQRIVGLQGIFWDITNRKQAEETLREAEKRYRDLFEDAVEGIFQSTPEGRLLLSNPALAKMYGYASPEEIISLVHSIGDQLYLNPEDRHHFRRLLSKQREIKEFEAQHKRKDGSSLWASMSARVVCDENGDVLCYEGRVIDVTQRKHAEEVLRRYELLSKNTREIILFLSHDGRIIEANEAALRAYGYDRETLLSLRIHDLRAPQTRHLTEGLIARAFEGGFLIETEHIRKDGSAFPVEVSSRGVEVGEGKVLLSVIRDITERKKAETKLRDHIYFLQELIDSIPYPLFFKDIDGVYQGCNTAYENLINLPRSEIVGRTAYEIVSKDLADKFHEMDQTLFQQGGPQIYDFQVRNPDGTTRDVIINKAVFGKADGTPGGLVGVIIDITARKRLEEELRQSQKMEAIGTLAGGIAHDFNNVLAIMMGYSEVALLHAQKDAKVCAGIQEVIKACRRAADLVRQILSFSRKNEQDRKPILVAPIFKETVKLLRAGLPATIEIRQRVQSAVLILGDPTEMHQIIMNLATNAYHAMREEGGVLELVLEDVEVDKICQIGSQALSPGRYVRLAVRDTGHGIEAGVLERIFDPYFTTKPTGEGTGLGLAVVRGIVMECGGTMDVQSELGRGTAFEIYFPGVEEELVEPAGEPSESVPTGDERVLLIDDEEALLELGKGMLEHLGYRVTATSDSQAGLDAFYLEPEKFDAVITDMTMPHLTGLELARKVFGVRPDIPVVLCTGFSDLVDKDRALEAGIRFFLIKPVSLLTLAKNLREALDESRELSEVNGLTRQEDQ
jgi:PAS domain S-box-containing protein